jgi:hypothetical protein
VVERLERLRSEGGGDIVETLFKPLPTMVVAHYVRRPTRVPFEPSRAGRAA